MSARLRPGAAIGPLAALLVVLAAALPVWGQDAAPAESLRSPAAGSDADERPAADADEGTGTDASDRFDPDAAPAPRRGGVAGRHRMAETVVTGTKTPHAADDAPVPTQVITREQIDAVQAGGIDEVLSLIPDIYVRQNEQFGLGASTVRMQGADPNKVLILLDGQRFLGGVNGVVDLRDIPATNIEQIEIIRGPASSLYGSDAMAGVINIRTRSGSDTPYVAATAAGGSFDRQLYNAAVGYHLGPVRFFLSGQHDQVKIGKLLGPISAQFEGDGANDLQERDIGFIRLDLPLEKHDFRIEANYVNERNPLSDNQDLATGFAWNWDIAPGWTSDLLVSRYGFERTNDLVGFVEDVDYATWTPEARVTKSLADLVWGTDHVFILGLRARTENLDTPARVIGLADAGFVSPAVDEGVYQISPFIQDEIFLGDQVSLVVGSSFDKHSRYGLEVNPRLTATYRPWDFLSVAFTAGRGYRAPDLLQFFDVDINNVVVVGDRVTGYAIVGNPNLKAETDVAFNLNVDFRWRDVVRGSASLFRHDFKNLIGNSIACSSPTTCEPGFTNPFPELQGPIFSFENVAKARTQGLELGVELMPVNWLDPDLALAHQLEVGLGYGFLDTENRSGIPGEDGKQLPFRPKNRVIPSVTYAYEPSETRLKVWGEYESEIFADFINSPEEKVDPYWTWNFKLDQKLAPGLRAVGVDVPPWAEGLGVFVQGLNVFDEVIEIAAVVAQRQQFSPRQAFLGGVTYVFD